MPRIKLKQADQISQISRISIKKALREGGKKNGKEGTALGACPGGIPGEVTGGAVGMPDGDAMVLHEPGYSRSKSY